MWEALKSYKTSIDRILFEYKIDDDLVDMMFMKGYNERDVLSLIRLFPPS